MSHTCKEVDDNSNKDDCDYLTSAYILAGLSMMLNIRLAYSSAPYALIRFRLHENLFSVFVRRMASALELWCLPSMLLGNIVDMAMKLGTTEKVNYDWVDSTKENKLTDATAETKLIQNKWIKFGCIIVPSVVTMWSDFITYVILLYVYLTGGSQGRVTAYYGVIAVSGFIFGINMTLVYAADWRYIPVYIAGENSFPALTSIVHYLTTLVFGNRRKWNSDFIVVCVDISVAIIISFTTAILWTCAHVVGPDDSAEATNIKTGNPSTGRKSDSTIYSSLNTTGEGAQARLLWHIKPPDKIEDSPKATIVSPALMVIVGMGLVYAIYPGIAPGMIVPFYLIDKIEMVLLIATIFPPVIFAILQKHAADWSPKTNFVYHPKDPNKTGLQGWVPYASKHVNEQDPGGSETANFNCKTSGSGAETEDVHAWIWHLFDILIIVKISLAVIFIYSLHYKESSLSRAIVNQPKMSTFLTIVFYMCHEFLLALGFPGIVGNRGANYVMLPAQYIGALFMMFLVFYSEGYIIEYKSHDPAH